MNEKMLALLKNQTWKVVLLPKRKKIVGCRWVSIINYKSDGTVEHFKARLVAKGFTKCYGIDYMETFAPIAKMGTVCILVSLVLHYGWSVLQFDVKNAFLHREISEEIYMELPPSSGNMTILLLYVDDMIVTGDDMQEITFLQKQLTAVFDIKMLGQLKYFLGIEVAYFHSLTTGIYTNADYVGSVDDRRSTTGYCCLIGGNLVTWQSQK
ncbi:unnamed protein product [Spirodela intermedia]|uniref:Reverse transcriptase Ty1/copia-type domain-containing protein n=1 Tax=Spirodela intermedia TaxID=51605 RepID=A0A7I8KTC0_SPIIN|nr:unnamed protein product [Spirodela intermedia]